MSALNNRTLRGAGRATAPEGSPNGWSVSAGLHRASLNLRTDLEPMSTPISTRARLTSTRTSRREARNMVSSISITDSGDSLSPNRVNTRMGDDPNTPNIVDNVRTSPAMATPVSDPRRDLAASNIEMTPADPGEVSTPSTQPERGEEDVGELLVAAPVVATERPKRSVWSQDEINLLTTTANNILSTWVGGKTGLLTVIASAYESVATVKRTTKAVLSKVGSMNRANFFVNPGQQVLVSTSQATAREGVPTGRNPTLPR